ncbi:MAG: hypothetical protein RMJ89_13105, partial [Flammeovirgaceae bacterium]|nr:hypothetical protein [Flammeovirgaceae bacterium]
MLKQFKALLKNVPPILMLALIGLWFIPIAVIAGIVFQVAKGSRLDLESIAVSIAVIVACGAASALI